MLNPLITTIAETILKDESPGASFEEARRLAALPASETPDLIAWAHKIRQKHKGNKVFTCTIGNAKSGRCSEDCAFCAQSAHHDTGVDIYPLRAKEEMVADAGKMARAGAAKYGIVTSGNRLTDRELETVCAAVAAIRAETDLKVCASLGNLTGGMIAQLKDAGIASYHHNLETARSYFHRVCTTHDYEADVRTVKQVKAAGIPVCSGGILGLGESWDQRVELAFTLRELDVDSVPLNFLNPIAGTKMGDRPVMAPMAALKCIALFRFIHPDKDITICGGREVALGDLQSWVFAAGANGLMVGNYLTTRGRDLNMDFKMIADLEMTHENQR